MKQIINLEKLIKIFNKNFQVPVVIYIGGGCGKIFVREYILSQRRMNFKIVDTIITKVQR